MAAPSFQLPKPQALASSLPSLCLTHRHPTHQDFLLALPSKYVRSPNISHRSHCRHPGQATVISPLDYCHGPQPSPCFHFPSPGQGDPFIMSQMMSLFCPKPSSASHFILNKSPWFSKAARVPPYAVWPQLLHFPSPLRCSSHSALLVVPQVSQDLCTAAPTSAWNVLQTPAWLAPASFKHRHSWPISSQLV